MSTSFPGRLELRSEGSRRRPAVPGNSGLCPRSRGLEQLSWQTWAPVRGTAGSTRSPGPLAICCEGPRRRPAVLSGSGRVPRARGVNQLSWAHRALFRGPALSTSTPGRLGLGSDGPWLRPPFPVTRARLRGPRWRPVVREHSGHCPRSHGVDQLSWATRTLIRGPLVSTSSPGFLGPGSEGPRCRPAFLGDSASALMALGVDQLSRATPARL